MHVLGLLPLIRKVCISGKNHKLFSPQLFRLFRYCTLHQFSILTNVQELDIKYLDIPSFMSRVHQYFGHFSPTVRHLSLRKPRGSCRQIVYFIGLFPHLQDLDIYHDRVESEVEPAEDLTLFPPSIPPLQGWLRIENVKRVDLLKVMVDLFGGIRFRYMHIYDVDGMQLLLDACATTLEALMLFPTDPRGEQLPLNDVEVLANDFAARSSLQDFDLSRNKSLWMLQVPVSDIDRTLNDAPPNNASGFLKHMLSTITFSGVFKIMVVYLDSDFHCVESISEEASRHHRRFEVLREARKVRNFRLVLCVSVSGHGGESHIRTLEEAIAEEKARNGFDNYFSEPSVMYSPRRFHTAGY